MRRDCAGRQASPQGVERVPPGGQLAGDVRRDVHHVAVTFDGHHVRQLDGAVAGDAADVVASQVDQHHVLGPFLGVGQKFFGQPAILFFAAPRRRVPANGRTVTSPCMQRTRISGELPTSVTCGVRR